MATKRKLELRDCMYFSNNRKKNLYVFIMSWLNLIIHHRIASVGYVKNEERKLIPWLIVNKFV